MQTQLLEIKKTGNDYFRAILTTNRNTTNEIAFLLAGFENPATTEKKFKILADELAKADIASLRIDFEGVGLSDGNFSDFCLDSMKQDLKLLKGHIANNYNFKNQFLVTHSLASVVAPDFAKSFDKFVLIAPALNQKELLRFWFTRDRMKNENPKVLVNLNNYKQYLDEDLFQKELSRKDKMTRRNYFPMKYFNEVSDKDFSTGFEKINSKSLVILGEADQDVPIESIKFEINNKFVVKGGDHNLERPKILEGWVREVVRYLDL